MKIFIYLSILVPEIDQPSLYEYLLTHPNLISGFLQPFENLELFSRRLLELYYRYVGFINDMGNDDQIEIDEIDLTLSEWLLNKTFLFNTPNKEKKKEDTTKDNDIFDWARYSIPNDEDLNRIRNIQNLENQLDQITNRLDSLSISEPYVPNIEPEHTQTLFLHNKKLYSDEKKLKLEIEKEQKQNVSVPRVNLQLNPSGESIIILHRPKGLKGKSKKSRQSRESRSQTIILQHRKNKQKKAKKELNKKILELGGPQYKNNELNFTKLNETVIKGNFTESDNDIEIHDDDEEEDKISLSYDDDNNTDIPNKEEEDEYEYWDGEYDPNDKTYEDEDQNTFRDIKPIEPNITTIKRLIKENPKRNYTAYHFYEKYSRDPDKRYILDQISLYLKKYVNQKEFYLDQIVDMGLLGKLGMVDIMAVKYEKYEPPILTYPFAWLWEQLVDFSKLVMNLSLSHLFYADLVVKGAMTVLAMQGIALSPMVMGVYSFYNRITRYVMPVARFAGYYNRGSSISNILFNEMINYQIQRAGDVILRNMPLPQENMNWIDNPEYLRNLNNQHNRIQNEVFNQLRDVVRQNYDDRIHINLDELPDINIIHNDNVNNLVANTGKMFKDILKHIKNNKK